MIVVSNASPLINLARIGQLDLLRQLYGELLMPEAVGRKWSFKASAKPERPKGLRPGGLNARPLLTGAGDRSTAGFGRR